MEAIKRDQLPRLLKKFREQAAGALMKEFEYASNMQIPRLQKIVINSGLGEAIADPKVLDATVAEIGAITGQKPVVTKARKSIANFKLRQDMKIGVKVTLRREKMWEFLDRFVNVALPRVRDFKGLSPKAFDGRGNYTVGVKEQTMFPEINYDKVEKVVGMNLSFVTSAQSDKEGRALLRHLGMPFRK